METIAAEFIARFAQLRYDHKPVEKVIEIIDYEFKNLICKKETECGISTYSFSDSTAIEQRNDILIPLK